MSVGIVVIQPNWWNPHWILVVISLGIVHKTDSKGFFEHSAIIVVFHVDRETSPIQHSMRLESNIELGDCWITE